MKKQSFLFNEDNLKSKQIFTVFMILFSIGAVISLIGIIVFSGLVSKNSLFHRDLNGIDILITFLYWFLSIYLYVFVFKSKRFSYYITITDTELNVLINNNLKTFNVKDLIDYQIIKNHISYPKFIVKFGDTNKIIVKTRKPKELKTVLDKIMNMNKNSPL